MSDKDCEIPQQTAWHPEEGSDAPAPFHFLGQGLCLSGSQVLVSHYNFRTPGKQGQCLPFRAPVTTHLGLQIPLPWGSTLTNDLYAMQRDRVHMHSREADAVSVPILLSPSRGNLGVGETGTLILECQRPCKA